MAIAPPVPLQRLFGTRLNRRSPVDCSGFAFKLCFGDLKQEIDDASLAAFASHLVLLLFRFFRWQLFDHRQLAVQKDERGSVMFRFAPSWNYADLTYSPSGLSLFKPGQNYQGMQVKPLPTPKQFLTEMFQALRPQATAATIIAEDPMREMVEAISRVNQQVNQQLQQAGLQPNRYDGLAMLVEYTEGGQRYREVLRTILSDARPSALMWTNEHTIHFRAPMSEFQAWKPALDVIFTYTDEKAYNPSEHEKRPNYEWKQTPARPR